MRRKRYAIEDLRRAIDCLPVDTRVAMLQGVRSNDIIVGAYTTRDGGVCPMLAAHRCGGRTSLVSFAHTWDRFTKAKRARRATERELRILIAHLESSLLAEGLPELQQVIASHRAGLERNAAEHGTFRRRRLRQADVYERALAIVEAERDRLAAEAAAEAAAPAPREPELV
ncbi:MAG TPA: hypothetical protein VNB64_01385 [Solirubrobacteraceae bacterium]|nr:hypothetical protein [Solirubrobacteraceae bacterium]